MMTCPDCKGTGLTPFRLFNIKTRGVIEVSANMYYSYPKDEDGAVEKGEFLCRIPREECPTCHGEGEIPEDY
jgi:DnaJ-class molecular chaperone